MRRPVRPRIGAALALLALVPLTGACGIESTEVADAGAVPVISVEPTLQTVYLLRRNKLEPHSVSTSSGMMGDVLDALFKAGEPPPPGMKSALTGFVHGDSDISNYGPRSRNDPEMPSGLRVHVFVRGDRELTRHGLAQITCTAMLSKDVWVVKITQVSTKGPRSRGEHVCSEFRDLAARDTQLPP